MREQFRPYTLVADITETTPSSITLTDSEGTALECNFVSVEGSSNSDAFFSVILSSIQVEAGVLSKHAATMQGTVSGVIGGTARLQQGVVEFVLSDGDRVSEITISQNTGDDARYFINYGEVYTGNPLRAQMRPKGN